MIDEKYILEHGTELQKEMFRAGVKNVDDVIAFENNKREKEEKAKKRKEDVEYYKKRMNKKKTKNFENRLDRAKEAEYLKPLLGLYKNDVPTTIEERRSNVLDALLVLQEINAVNDLKLGDSLRMTNSYRSKLKNAATRMFDFMERTGKDASIYADQGKESLQGLLMTQFNKEGGGANEDKSIDGYLAMYQTINVIESLIYDTDLDYSSQVKTRAELIDIDEYKKTVIKKGDNTRAKAFKQEDIQKMNDYIMDKCKGDLTKAPEAHIMALLTSEFGMRRSTVAQLTINDIDTKNGVINVPSYKNKSGVSYTARALSSDVNQLLGQIVERAMLKNYNKLDDSGEIKLITSSKSNQYKEFDRLLKKVGLLEEYRDNKFHACRRYFGQAAWDILRGGEYKDDKRGCKYEVNEWLGHSKKELSNLDSYVSDMY